MELFSAEIDRIKGLVEAWKNKPDVELEATFGNGTVDMQTFLRVITRLKSKGNHEISQEESLTVGLRDSRRFTLRGEGDIKKYCYDNTMAGKAYIAIIKDRNVSNDQSDIVLDQYNVKLKARREMPMDASDIQQILSNWPKEKKYFRLIRRWTFHWHGVKFDLSMVRSTPTGKTVYTFQDINILAQPPVYEIEVEIDRDALNDKPAEEVYKNFIQGIGEILRGIQGNSILIRKKVVEETLKGYEQLTKVSKFRGVNPVTLGVRHMVKEKQQGEYNIRENYNVTDKADGLRVHGFVDEKGELFMIDMTMNVYKTGLKNPNCKGSLMDGEYVTQGKNGKSVQELLFFDIYYYEGKDISQKPFSERHNLMKSWIQAWNRDGGPQKLYKSVALNVTLKSFFIAKGDDIFEMSRRVLDNDSIRNYHTDGLIFTPNNEGLPEKAGATFKEQFKWKPAKDNTVDFLVVMEKDVENNKVDKIVSGIKHDTEKEINYKIARLLVSSSKPPNPRDVILNKESMDKYNNGKLKPVLFNPVDFPDLMANACYMEVEMDNETKEEYAKAETGEPIRDNSIVEMRYDTTKPPGWRWIPMRVRVDKTERYAKGIKKGEIQRTMNNEAVANDIWVSIHDPVTEHMIRTGNEAPTDEERREMAVLPSDIKKRYREKGDNTFDRTKVQTMLNFHNKYIKLELLYGAVFTEGRGKKLLDMAVGEASDLHKWIDGGATFVLGIDLAGESILNNNKGAYKRLLQRYEQNRNNKKPIPIPPIFFVIGDSSKRIYDGDAGSTEQEKDILRSIFGYPGGPVPALVEDKGAGELRGGVDSIVCMYAIHYFFSSETIFNGFLDNINKTLKVGGLFVGTNFDGEAVFNLLRHTKEGETVSGIEDGSSLWEITKKYSAEEMPIDSSAFGMAVDVKFITIGMSHIEYLVPWQLLVSKMKSIGCELVGAEELATMGLKSSTNMYETSYDMVQKLKSDKKNLYRIQNAAAKQFSFLNRWYIFKRVSKSGEGPVAEGPVAEGPVAEGPEGPVAEGPAAVGPVAESPVPVGTVARKKPTIVRKPTEDLRPLSAQVEAAGTAKPTEFVESITGGPAPAAPAPAAPEGGPAAPRLDATVPVQTSAAAILQQKKFSKNEFFSFKEDSLSDHGLDKLTLPEKYRKYAARWMAPNAPFPIKDTTDETDTKEYPSITHFLIAMKFKYATTKPLLANEFTRDGTIHQGFLADRQAERKFKGKLSEDRYYQILLLEYRAIKNKSPDIGNEKTGFGFDILKWASVKDKLLRAAIQQRLQKDKWFCIIVNAVIVQNKYMLYLDTKTSELGGVREGDGKIQGENKYGKFILEMATSSPEILKACADAGQEPPV